MMKKTKVKNNIELTWKTINIFESMRWMGFIIGYKVSQDKLDWEAEVRIFNDLILSSKKKNIPYSQIAQTLAESYKNTSEAIALQRGGARARVIDLIASFREFI